MRRILFLRYLLLLQIFCVSEKAISGIENRHLFEENHGTSAANISGVVWYDQNINGMIDDNEPALANIPVLLFTCNGQFVNATTTLNNGTYAFGNVPNGSYKIYASLANTGNLFSFTIQNETTDNHVDDSGYSECIIADDDNFSLNAGITIFPVIGDKVWEDIDGNGIQDFGEPGIANVIVEAFSDETLVASTSTDNNGNYFFNTLLPANYVFRFLASEEYKPTIHIPFHPSNSKITNDNGPFTTAGFEIQTTSDGSIDAGFYRCAKICGIIYNDVNESDSLDVFENGITGVRVNLWQIVDGDTLFYGLTTTGLKPSTPSTDGYYEFCVPPGTYFVEIDRSDLPEYLPGAPLATDNPETFNHFFEYDDILATYEITLESNDSYCNINQGFYCTGEITSRVWLDSNQNGLQDVSESGLENIEVTLRNSSGTIVRVGSTDEFGIVNFKTVRKGSYYLQYTIGNTYIFTSPYQGPVLIDSDVNGYFGEGTTPLFDLTSCSVLSGIDAGVSLKPLPLTWLSVFAENTTKGVNKILWEVAKEVNVSHYQVQKSMDGLSWTDISKVSAKGNVTDITEYNYWDEQADEQNIYYRIQSNDFDGAISYSEIVHVRSKNQKNHITTTPNPANNIVQIQIVGVSEDELVAITLISQMGQKVMEIPYAASVSSVSLENIPDGIYYIHVKSESGQLYNQKLVVKK